MAEITIRDALVAIAQLSHTYEYAQQLTQDVGGYQMEYDRGTNEWVIHPVQPDQIRRYTMRTDQAQSHIETLRKTEECLLRVCLLPYIDSYMTGQDLQIFCTDDDSAHYLFWETQDAADARYWRRAGVDESLPDRAIFALGRVQSWWRRGPQVQY